MEGLTSFFLGFFFSRPRVSLLPMVLLLLVAQEFGVPVPTALYPIRFSSCKEVWHFRARWVQPPRGLFTAQESLGDAMKYDPRISLFRMFSAYAEIIPTRRVTTRKCSPS